MERTAHPPHFQGKSSIEHVIEARKKGSQATSEIHGAEVSGQHFAFTDAAKETALLLSIVFLLHNILPIHQALLLLGFSFAFLIWKTSRSALLGWSRLERVHRLIEEERWEIEHHRSQEKEELEALYKAKGFTGKLLNEVIQVLMADDNRLLQVMLEEELGLTLGGIEHPLKQASGAFLGVLSASVLFFAFYFFLPPWSIWIIVFAIIALSSIWSAKSQKNKLILNTTWNIAACVLTIIASYFLIQYLSRFLTNGSLSL